VATDPEPQKEQPIEQPVTAPVVPLFYSNAVAAHPGAFDVVLDFAFQLGDQPDGPAQLGVRVAMSWEHTDALVRILSGLLEKYQEELGPLPDTQKARVEREQP
jgi:hypothetical protein